MIKSADYRITVEQLRWLADAVSELDGARCAFRGKTREEMTALVMTCHNVIEAVLGPDRGLVYCDMGDELVSDADHGVIGTDHA